MNASHEILYRHHYNWWQYQQSQRIAALFGLLLVNELEVLQSVSRPKKKRRRPPKFWVRPIFQRRHEQGAYNNLVQEMRLQDTEMHFNYFRMSKEIFDRVLSKVGPRISKTNYIREPLSAGERLAVTLRYLASGDSMRSISFAFRIGKSTTSKVILETCLGLWDVLKDEVMPTPTTADWRDNAEQFLNLWDLPHCVGAIDGKHVVIQAPPHSGSEFFNYKKTHSIVLLAACNAEYQFTVVDVGAKGKQSDGGIFRHSNFGRCLLGNSLNLPPPEPLECGGEDDMPYFFAGDEAFPLHVNLMRPYPGSFLSQTKRIYNYRLSRGRRVIENAFGILCARWRIFRKPILASLERIEAMVLATVCLHNFLMKKTQITHTPYCPRTFADSEDNNGNLIAGEWRNDHNEVQNLESIRQLGTNTYTRNASQIRDNLAQFFITDGSVTFQWDK